LQCFFLREFSLGFDFFLQSSLLAVFIYKVVVIGSLENFDKPNNVGGVLNLRKRIDLVDGELLKLWTEPKFLYLDDLDCDCLARFFIVGFIHLAELPRTDNGFKDVILNFFSH
jgi:hypothetical protein